MGNDVAVDSKFKITGSIEERYGTEPNHSLEVEYTQTDDDRVLVGVGLRAKSDNITTMHLKYARIDENGNVDTEDTELVKEGTDPNHQLEVWLQCPKQNEVIVGLGLRAKSDNVTTMRIYTRTLNTDTGKLEHPDEHRGGSEPDHTLEVKGLPTTEEDITLLRGLGLRMRSDNITTMANFYGKVSPR